MNRVISSTALSVLVPAMLLGASVSEATGNGLRATAEVRGCIDSNIRGSLVLNEQRTEQGIKQVVATLAIEGLSDGEHAVHIHETAACEPCGAAAGHHDPGPNSNTDPDAPQFNHPFHMGDLINVKVRDGKGIMQTTTNRITLSPGRLSIFDQDGSAVIVHTDKDTYCDQDDELSSGCAGGARDACGIIKLDSSGDGPFGLSVSSSSKRSPARALDGSTVSGKTFIFLTPLYPDAKIRKVEYFIDGNNVRTENLAPYDLAGTFRSKKAAAFDTRKLSNGAHVLSAQVHLASGDAVSTQVTFGVDN